MIGGRVQLVLDQATYCPVPADSPPDRYVPMDGDWLVEVSSTTSNDTLWSAAALLVGSCVQGYRKVALPTASAFLPAALLPHRKANLPTGYQLRGNARESYRKRNPPTDALSSSPRLLPTVATALVEGPWCHSRLEQTRLPKYLVLKLAVLAVMMHWPRLLLALLLGPVLHLELHTVGWVERRQRERAGGGVGGGVKTST